ncbi:MAG: hypothetical protein J0I54_17890 [Bosea sp.]|uniref:hypothetical protein n=1 Tax=unclassified Bosea (in: a-proteobacteria) TaxID=2653178 RepID=UPI00096924D0|nr:MULTISPECIES: hypothetical protein [unclassified Bosea (in: a-proteobacteria)]MBN9458506.1 hypothetical protein [Bosea sp. (in: a-proteobacteria)]OJV06794.1 MAG: hypothetical protein BGO20_00060 [Bosea sp. 67-29]
MSRGQRRTPEMGRTKTQSYCLLAARSGKLYENDRRELVMAQAHGKFLPVRTFGKPIVKECEKAGWIVRIPNHGWERIMTTPAGDRELERPLRLRPFADAWQDQQREALR